MNALRKANRRFLSSSATCEMAMEVPFFALSSRNSRLFIRSTR